MKAAKEICVGYFVTLIGVVIIMAYMFLSERLATFYYETACHLLGRDTYSNGFLDAVIFAPAFALWIFVTIVSATAIVDYFFPERAKRDKRG